MKEIPLTQGKVAIVDDDMFEELSKFTWFCHSNGYAARHICCKGKQRTVWMHRVIAETPDDMETDHINGNKRDNRRSNLRRCFPVENRRNMKIRTDNSSNFKGVSWFERDNKWSARIGIGGKRIHLGLFENILDAARAYDKAAREQFGEFARTNF